jgi:hypothetical protein
LHLQTPSITASKCISEFTQSQSRIASPNSLDHGLEVHLQTHSITDSQCISKLAQSRPPSESLSSLDLGIQVHLQTRSIRASEWISEFTRSWPPMVSLSSLDLGLQVHVSARSITASKYIVIERRRVYGDTGVTEVDCATGSSFLGVPRVDKHHLILISSSSHLDPRNCVDSHCRVVSYLLTFFLGSSSYNLSSSQILFGCRERCGGMSMVGSPPSSSVISP